MITEDLFQNVLVDPVTHGANTLYIVSGYATAAMTFHHLEHLKRTLDQQIKVNLIVGMCPQDGLSLSNHKAFQQLTTDSFPGYFECSYIVSAPQVHSKAYAWYRDEDPIVGFIGSANYTQNAFSKSQREILLTCNPRFSFDYFQSLVSESVYCTHNEIENYIQIYRDTYQGRKKKEQLEKQGAPFFALAEGDFQGLPAVRISFLDKHGDLPQRSGLNWGQRPKEKREPNQAYIRLPSSVYKTNFFPPKAVHFTVSTDDNKVLICTRAQENNKAIHTPQNNSLIGEYFRHRLSIPSGRPVTKADLLRYGRTDVEFYKIDDETYFMNFSV